jgi:4-alpha-glucanotransferase
VRNASLGELYRLARLYGVETAYYDVAGRLCAAAPESLLAVLKALGAPVQSPGDVPDALRQRRQEIWRRCLEPVTVLRQGQIGSVKLRLPADTAESNAEFVLELENGETARWSARLAGLPVLRSSRVEGADYTVRELTLPAGLPPGYHRLRLSLPARTCRTLLICAPRRAYTPPPGTDGRIWGVFLPLYALSSERNWGAGDLADLQNLLEWVQELGGGFAGTLPLLATFLEEPFAPSPYTPVSRLFWNEFYLDPARAPELPRCPEAQDLLRSAGFQRELAALRAVPLVDYRRGMAVKRRVLQLLARCCFAGGTERLAALMRWAAERPEAQDYARFRAAGERRLAGWPAWTERARGGDLREGDYDPEAAHYHLYVQWLAEEQFQELSRRARRGPGQGLYLDLPLGVHPAGYDTWRERAAFALEASAGAPPDPFFEQGQDWGFPPLHPERIRERGYRYFRACLRHHLRHAAVLRLDHVMGLHRLFWVPRGCPARDGVYVRYRAEEFYAVLTLESQRHQTLIVGEDLGTVPASVRPALARHRIHRMYVLPFEYTGDAERALRPPGTGTLACLNTHDMPPFKTFWLEKEKNIRDRVALPLHLHRQGWLDVPTNSAEAVLRGVLRYLAASRARLLSVNLEDLWLETAPQNVPGTVEEYPNWRRKARFPLEVFTGEPEVQAALKEVDRLRKRYPR